MELLRLSLALLLANDACQAIPKKYIRGLRPPRDFISARSRLRSGMLRIIPTSRLSGRNINSSDVLIIGWGIFRYVRIIALNAHDLAIVIMHYAC